MKAIIGIDAQGDWKPAFNLFCRLGFKNPQLTLLHAYNPALPFAPADLLSSMQAQSDYARVLKELGETALQEAMATVCPSDIPVKSALSIGSPADELIRRAVDDEADLIAVQSTHRGSMSSFLLGSVSRGLALGARASVMVGKGDVKPQGGIRAVFATDHSDYADRCLERLVELAPKGLSEVDVVTAFEVNAYEALLLNINLPGLGSQVNEWMQEKLEALNAKVVEKLERLGVVARSHVIEGHPDDVIPETMKVTGADLLILGAQGHGFIDRLLIGSVSFRQIVAEPYPVLLLRV